MSEQNISGKFDMKSLRSEALELQRHKNFSAACEKFTLILNHTNVDENRYRDVNNVLVCIYNLIKRVEKKEDREHLFKEFEKYVNEYLSLAQRYDTTSWANNILEDLLEYIIDVGLIHYTENPNDFDGQRNQLTQWLDKHVVSFINQLKIDEKRETKLFYDVVLRAIFKERANFERQGHDYQNVANTRTLGVFFLRLTADVENISRSRSSVYLLFSELVFNDPEQVNQDYYLLMRRAVEFLDKSISEFKENHFARKRREQLNISLMIQEQLHRFQHDVNSKISTLNSLIRKIKRKAPELKESMEMERIMSDIGVILNLSREENSIPGFEEVDMPSFFEQIRKESRLNLEIDVHGEKKVWLSHRATLNMIFENLIKNSREAYERRQITPLEPAMLIQADLDAGVIKVQDWAGGIREDLLSDKRLFEPYVSEKGVATNTGLGLGLVKKACRILGLEINFQVENASTIVTLKKEKES